MKEQTEINFIKAARETKGKPVEWRNFWEEKEEIAAEKASGKANDVYANILYTKIESKSSALKDIEKQTGKVLPCWVTRGLSYAVGQEAPEMHDPMVQEQRKHEASQALAYIRAIYKKMMNGKSK
ncbi:MAG: hypothetical protein LBE98_02465 [Puniceicoccales bacterium]|jgi:hypothetical protein|nr:hypothetical protein [Puniceicoccales bacterium]